MPPFSIRMAAGLFVVIALLGCMGTTGSHKQSTPQPGHGAHWGGFSDISVPEAEVSLDEVQAILEESGFEMRRLGRDGGASSSLLVVQGEPKILLSVNRVRHDVEMAVLYSIRVKPDESIYRRLNDMNRKLPCQASVTEDGNLLLETYLPYDNGLYVDLLTIAVTKFQTYSRTCAVHLKDVIR